MVAPNLLVMKHRTTPSHLGFLSGGTSYTQLGGATGSAENTSDPASRPSNRGVWFKGIHCCVGMDPGGNWQIHAYDPVANILQTPATITHGNVLSARACSGLFVVNTNNPRLFFVWGDANDASLKIRYSSDAVNWTTSTLIGGNVCQGLGRAIIYRNQMFITSTHPSSTSYPALFVIDPIAITATSFSYASFGWEHNSPQGSFCVFRNRVFLLRMTTSSGSLLFYEFTGGTLVVRNTLITPIAATVSYLHCDHFLFPVGSTKMVAIAFVDTGNSQPTRGAKGWDLVPSGSVDFAATDKTTTLIPVALRRTADGGPTGVLADNHRWTGFVDNDFNTVPGSPQVYIWLLSGVPGTHSYYEYVDSDTELAPGSTGLNQDFALPYGSSGGGDRTYAAGALKALAYSVAPSPSLGRMRLTARVFGDVDPAVSSSGGGTVPTFGGGRHAPVVAATTGALPACTYNNGAAGIGATLTGNVSGALPLQDNVLLAATQRLLVKSQANAFENGIYAVTQVGDGSNPFILTRTTDADQVSYTPSVGITNGAWVSVTSGDTLGGTAWYLRISNGNINFGTTALNWSQIASLDRRLRIWYSTNETPDMSQATLAGTPTENYGQAPSPTRNGNALENIVADGVTLYTFDWDATTDGLQSGQPLNFMVRPGTA